MRDNNTPAMSLKLTREMKVSTGEIDIAEVFNSTLSNEYLYFAFESRYDPFAGFVHDDLNPIDLVVEKANGLQCLRPLEIKLTTLPDLLQLISKNPCTVANW